MRRLSPEDDVAPDEGDAPLSNEASDLDDRARGVISDLTDFDVHKRDRSLKSRRRLAGYFLLFLALLVAVTLVALGSSSPPATSGSEQTRVDEDNVTAPAVRTMTEVDGPLAGAWTMYATGSDGNERHAFTVRFNGVNAGTVEILEDTTEFDATFEMEEDRVSFAFTRILDLDTGDWAETSVFEGRLVNENEISGYYAREDWSCLPDRDPPCAYEPEPIQFASRLVREP